MDHGDRSYIDMHTICIVDAYSLVYNYAMEDFYENNSGPS